jgi:hypothetical protein
MTRLGVLLHGLDDRPLYRLWFTGAAGGDTAISRIAAKAREQGVTVKGSLASINGAA